MDSKDNILGLEARKHFNRDSKREPTGVDVHRTWQTHILLGPYVGTIPGPLQGEMEVCWQNPTEVTSQKCLSTRCMWLLQFFPTSHVFVILINAQVGGVVRAGSDAGAQRSLKIGSGLFLQSLLLMGFTSACAAGIHPLLNVSLNETGKKPESPEW